MQREEDGPQALPLPGGPSDILDIQNEDAQNLLYPDGSQPPTSLDNVIIDANTQTSNRAQALSMAGGGKAVGNVSSTRGRPPTPPIEAWGSNSGLEMEPMGSQFEEV